MKLEGVHHVTAVTADAQANLDFYVGVMGLRLVKKTVNQDETSVYHLFYSDAEGSPGSDLTFFEFRGAPSGRAGAGMVHQIDWRLQSSEAVEFWVERIGSQGIETTLSEDAISFDDPEGLTHRLAVADVPDSPLIGDHPEIPAEFALQGFDGVRAYATNPQATVSLLEQLSFEGSGLEWEARGSERGGHFHIDQPPSERGLGGGGTVHHIAWASSTDELEQWGERVRLVGGHPTPVIDRFYFRSIYFREPSGALFEIATMGPGFAVDEPQETLGEALSLPPDFEHLRERVEASLTPLRHPLSGE